MTGETEARAGSSWRSLQAQSFAVVATLVIVFGGSGFVLLFDLFAQYSATMTEALNRPLAARVAEDLRTVMREGGDAKSGVARLFGRFMDVNPNVELYLVSAAGDILAFSAPPGEVKRERIDLAPVKALIANQFVYPIFADDPKDVTRRKVFSAAPLDPETPGSGYVFIILGGADYDQAARRIQGGLLARGALILAGVGLFAGVSAMLLARRGLIARLRRLAGEMTAFQASGYRNAAFRPAAAETGDDGT